MALLFPVSCAGKRGGVDLKDGLKIWSENYQAPDEHSGNTYLNLAGIPSSTTNIPSPFTTAYAPNRDEGFFNEGLFAPTDFSNYTVFGVVRKKSTTYGRMIIGGYVDGVNTTNTNGDAWFESSNNSTYSFRCNRTAVRNVGITLNQWHSFVMVKDGTQMQVYKDGNLEHDFAGGSTTPTNFWRGWDSQQTDLLVFGISNRTWTLEDAEYFHNGGSFLRYSDLP